jgi:threonylcarbamoyladenosine tRNA methylthiotransferase MtaB
MTTVAVATLGCKVNQFESEALMDSFEQRGYVLVPFGEGADITIINTCTVTHRADFQSRQLIRRASRSNPKSLIVVTGCYSQVEPEAIARIEGVQYLFGNRGKGQIPDLIPLMQKGEFPRIRVSEIQE